MEETIFYKARIGVFAVSLEWYEPVLRGQAGQGFGQRFPFILTIFCVDIHYCSRLLEIVQRIGMHPTIVEFR